MTEEQFSEISMYILLTGLIIWMGYIVWDLSKRSNAGKFGTMVLYFALGLGVLGFIIKTVIVEVMNV